MVYKASHILIRIEMIDKNWVQMSLLMNWIPFMITKMILETNHLLQKWSNEYELRE